MKRETFQQIFLLSLVIAISLIFFSMIRSFALTLLLAGIFAGLLQPFYQRLLTPFREHRSLASLCTILVFVLAVVIPLLLFLGIVAGQAFDISKSAAPWIERQLTEPDRLSQWFRNLPGFEYVEPYREEILQRLATVAGNVGNFVVRGLSAATSGTVAFFFQFFIFLYALFFFLIDGQALLRKIMYYMPLSSADEGRLMAKFSSVTRATLKGTLVIGVIQGGMAGIGLAVAGIGGSVFWGTVMVVLSIVPGIGTALVWVPAVIYLLAVGKVLAGVLLAVYCAVVVGSVDNLLRPRLVGRDTKMPDLMILLGTLGGILLFGVVGFIIGPVIAALLITVWDIYGDAFSYALVESKSSRGGHRTQARGKPSGTRDASRQRAGDSKSPDGKSQRRGVRREKRTGDDKGGRDESRPQGPRRRRTGTQRRPGSERRPGGDDRNGQ
jgi:predicted PurR-regulated permease PerM